MIQPRHRPAAGLRYTSLALLTGFTAVWGFLHQWVQDWKTAGVDALCPFGPLESAWSLITKGEFLTKVGTSSLVILIGTLLTSLVFRRAFCGHICPLGFLQEVFGNLGRKIWKTPPKLPTWADALLRNFKYLVLSGVAILSWVFADLVVRSYDPWVAWMHLTSPELFTEMALGFGLLLVGLGASVFQQRAFCRYACPMGAVLALTSKVGLARVVRNTETCINCKACTHSCPVDIPVHQLQQVTTTECLSCGLCVTACPVKKTLDFQVGRRGPKVPAWGLTLGAILILAVTMIVGAALGQFSMLRSITPTARTVDLGSTSIDIRGRDTLTEVAKATGIPLETLLMTFEVNEEDAAKQLKELETKYPGLSPEIVRNKVKELLNPRP